MRIGLLGGSFNPPHAAHRAISLFALKRLKLDRVWWLLTPGNPLKDTGALHGLAERAQAARDVAGDPRIDALLRAAQTHADAGLSAISPDHYAGAHWLGSFAVYLVSGRGLR